MVYQKESSNDSTITVKVLVAQEETKEKRVTVTMQPVETTGTKIAKVERLTSIPKGIENNPSMVYSRD